MTALPSLASGVPTIAVDGTASAVLETSLTAMVIEQDIEGLFACELLFANSGTRSGGVGFPLFDTELVDFGKDVVVTAGAGDAAGTLFTGIVTGIVAGFPQHGAGELAILADDQLQHLRMTRRTRVFEDMTNSEAISLVVGDHGLTAAVDLPEQQHRIIAQVDQSDLAFIRERARRVGAEVWLDGTEVNVAQRADRRTEPVTCSYRQNLREVQLAADLSEQRTHVDVTGWDVATKAPIDVSAEISLLASERAGGGRAGAEVLQEAFGERRERVMHTVPLAVDEAQAEAEARFRRRARRFVSGEIVVNGDARIAVGATVDLVGIGPWLAGTYDVVAVRHLFDLADGFRTEATVERMELSA